LRGGNIISIVSSTGCFIKYRCLKLCFHFINSLEEAFQSNDTTESMKMVKRTLYRIAWMLGLVSGGVYLLFALFGFFSHLPEIVENPVKSLTNLVSAGILGIMGFLILDAARLTKNGGQEATRGGVFMLIFGLVAYTVGGMMGATLGFFAGLIIIVTRYL